MTKTNWQDPKTGEIISPHISGLQEAVGKLEESIGIDTITETDIPLSEVFISNDDRCRIYQAPNGKRNWLLSPTPVIKKNEEVITTDFEIDYGGGAIIFTTPLSPTDTLTADVAYTKKVEGKQLSTEDFTTDEKNKLLNIEDEANKTDLSDDISSDDSSIAASSKAVKIVNDKVNKKVDKNDIVIDLVTDDDTKVLSARQGKVLKDYVDNLDISTDAESISYDNVESEIDADNVQGAIDEVNQKIKTHEAKIATQAHLAKNIGLEDMDELFIATELEGAMSELFTNVSNGKQLVGGAITDVDNNVVIPTDPTFNDLASAIGGISTGKKWASGTAVSDVSGSLTVNGLDFTPSIVAAQLDSFSRNRHWSLATKSSEISFNIALFMGNTLSGATAFTPTWRVDGFVISTLLTDREYHWIAIE